MTPTHRVTIYGLDGEPTHVLFQTWGWPADRRGERHAEQLFGPTLFVRTYGIEVVYDAGRLHGDVIPWSSILRTETRPV